MADRLITPASSRRAFRAGIPALILILVLLLFGLRWGVSLLIDYSWWKELGQTQTFIDLYTLSTLPIAAATIFCWIALLVAHARGVRFAGGRASDYPIYSRLAALALLVLSFLVTDARSEE